LRNFLRRSRTRRAWEALFDLLNGRNLRLYPATDLRAQALNTIAIESPRGWRIAKERASRKIDAIVALAMACVAAMDGRSGAYDGYLEWIKEQAERTQAEMAQAPTAPQRPLTEGERLIKQGLDKVVF
jgi:hypothetical protein